MARSRRPAPSTTFLLSSRTLRCTAAAGPANSPNPARPPARPPQGRALDGLRALKKQPVTTKLLSDTQARAGRLPPGAMRRFQGPSFPMQTWLA